MKKNTKFIFGYIIASLFITLVCLTSYLLSVQPPNIHFNLESKSADILLIAEEERFEFTMTTSGRKAYEVLCYETLCYYKYYEGHELVTGVTLGK